MFKYVSKVILKHIFYILSLLIIFFILYILKIPCFFRFLTGVPCPSCGMTRAFMALIKLKLTDSFYYHPLLIPSLITAFIAIHGDVPIFNINKKICDVYLWIFIIIFLAVYLFRLITCSIP